MATLIGLAFAFSATPRYTAESRVIIDKFDTAFSRGDHTDDRARDISEQLVTSQVEVLRSRDIAKRVVDALDLVDNPEFSGRGVPSRPLRGSLRRSASSAIPAARRRSKGRSKPITATSWSMWFR